MEGKGVLFKTFADIDVFDIELDANSIEDVVNAVVALAPTFGGINLEDIKAPECFHIEEELKARLNIPVFHDDQHGTAIIAGAALLNALEITNRKISEVTIVVSGAGAAAIACAKLLFNLGVERKNLLMVDSTGVIYEGREKGMNQYKQEFAIPTEARTLEDSLKNADVFFGLSAKDILKPAMLKTMAKDPIVFAMANPDPEIEYDIAKETRPDVIMATGRSDYPNQVNNVLGFPYIFRGALDVRAKGINEEMKMAAVRALANLAKEPVPESVRAAYGGTKFSFGPEYLIPKPFDPRVLYYVAPAVAQAAIESGVAREAIDISEYTLRLKEKQNHGRVMLKEYYSIAKEAEKKSIAFPEGSNDKVLKAATMAFDEGIVQPVLLGSSEKIKEAAFRLDLDVSKFQIIEPAKDPRFKQYADNYHKLQSRSGISQEDAEREMQKENIFANMLLSDAQVEGVLCGVGRSFPEMIRPILKMVGVKPEVKTAAGLYLVSIKDRLLFIADAAINIEMTSEKLTDIALMSANFAESFGIEPRVAMLSFSNFGSVEHPMASMIKDSVERIWQQRPGLKIDGEMQADTAVVASILKEHYPHSKLDAPANVLIFPDMQSANISFKLLQRLAGARVVGPIILGLKAPAYVLQKHATVDEIFNMITVAVGQANIQQRDHRLDLLPQVENLKVANFR